MFTESRRARSLEALTSTATLELISAGICFFFSLALLNANPSFIFLQKISSDSLN